MLSAYTESTRLFIENLCEEYPRYNYIDPKSYENSNIKRGLRNADNTGVLAGITRVGAVHGAVMQDGERVPIQGRLLYRGRSIEDLVGAVVNEGRFGFEEIVHLLFFGELPNQTRLAEFDRAMCELRTLPPGFTEDMILKAPSPNIMNKLARGILALYSYDENPDDCSLQNMLRQSMELIARVSTIVAHAYAVKRHYYDHESLILHHAMDGVSLAENFLHMIRPDSAYSKEEAHLLDLCMILHAEHGGGNNSSFTTRVLSSSGTDTYSALSAAVGSLKGPRHGGANIKVMQMFDVIRENVRDWTDDEEIESVLTRVIEKKLGDGSGLIYGMGHAVYTLSDPRANILKKYARELAPKHGMLEAFTLLESVERLTPAVFLKAKGDAKIMCANVDMYSGLVYEMLNIPSELYTPLFAIARASGWCAHRMEEALYGGRIIRPAYKALAPEVDYVPIADR